MWGWYKQPSSNRWWGFDNRRYAYSAIDIKEYNGLFYLMPNNEFDIEMQTTKLPAFATLDAAKTAAEMMMAMGMKP